MKMVLYNWNELFELINPDDAWVLENPYEFYGVSVKLLKFIPKGSYVKSVSDNILLTSFNHNQGDNHTSLWGRGVNGYYRNIIYGIDCICIKEILIPTCHIVLIQRAWRKYFLRKVKLFNDPIVHGLAEYFGHPSRLSFNLE